MRLIASSALVLVLSSATAHAATYEGTAAETFAKDALAQARTQLDLDPTMSARFGRVNLTGNQEKLTTDAGGLTFEGKGFYGKYSASTMSGAHPPASTHYYQDGTQFTLRGTAGSITTTGAVMGDAKHRWTFDLATGAIDHEDLKAAAGGLPDTTRSRVSSATVPALGRWRLGRTLAGLPRELAKELAAGRKAPQPVKIRTTTRETLEGGLHGPQPKVATTTAVRVGASRTWHAVDAPQAKALGTLGARPVRARR